MTLVLRTWSTVWGSIKALPKVLRYPVRMERNGLRIGGGISGGTSILNLTPIKDYDESSKIVL